VAGILPMFFAAATILLPRLDRDELARPLDYPASEEPAPTDPP
jgi:hypothetical protein